MSAPLDNLLLAGSAPAAEKEKTADKRPHYLITFLDAGSKPLGKATVYTALLEKKEGHFQNVPCKFVAIPNDGTGKETKAFQQLFRLSATGSARVDTSAKAPT